MATYLIDYENVKSEGIKGIAQLSEEDRVVIFYSHNADTITFEAMDMIFNSKAQVSKYKILCGGKNALDFQLSTYLGYLIHEAKDSYFYIISKDNGFKHVVDFWKRTFRFDGYVYCFATIADGNARQNRFKNATAKERARAMEEELAAMSEELEAQGDSDLEESEEDSAPETKEAVKEAVNEAEAVNDKESSEAEEMMQEEEPEETDEVAEQEIEEAPAEEEVQEEPTEEESAEEPVQENPSEKSVQEESTEEPVQEEPAKELVQEKSVEKEPAEEPVHEPEQQKENKEPENFASDTIIYPVQQHKPISVMPPAQLPDSVRKELEKADARYKDSSEEDLQKKIAAAVSASTITVVESGMTIHHVEEETKTKPVKKKAPAKTKKAPKQEEASENEVKPKKTRTAKTSKKKTEKEALAAEEKIEEKPAKPARKPITRSTRAKKEAAPAEEKPVKEKTAKEKPAKEKPVQEKSAEEATEPKKPARRGRRPKAQSNIAASFE